MKQKEIKKFCSILMNIHAVLCILFIYILAFGMARRNSDTFRLLRNSGLLYDNRGSLVDSMNEEDELPKSYRNNLYNSYSSFNSNNNNNNNNRRQQQMMLRADSTNSIKYNNKKSVMRLINDNNDNNNDDSRNSNLIRRNNNNNNNNNYNYNSNRKSNLPRQASVNSILKLNPSSSLWDESSIICHNVPGLTKEQMELCLKTPDVTAVALQGIQMATEECAFQMQKHRWNCSSLQGSVNPHSTQLLQKGYRESAFGHSIAAAGVAYAVAKACSQGKLLNCGCGFQYDDQVNYFPSKSADYAFDESNEAILKKAGATSWKWSGCSHNMNYGIKFAKTFLDSRERSSDLPSRTNLHNNRVGRLAVAENMEVRCKCHGLSGSCELRTCWKSAPDFRKVGTELKNKFRRAIMIDQSNFGNRPLHRINYDNDLMNLKKLSQQQQRRKRDRDRRQMKKFNKRSSGGVLNSIDLWYYEKSPTYCESNEDFNIPGTSGRRCNRTDWQTGGTNKDPGSCNTLCCGRGYNTIRQVYTTRCNCQFIWCCQVTCQNCTVDEWITVCK